MTHRCAAARLCSPGAGIDHEIRLTVSLAALAGTLLFVLFGSSAAELPSKQTVDVPALKAKS
jgi:hypothetical protein